MSNPQVPISGSIGSAGPFPTLGATTITLADANHTLADPSETCYQYILVKGPQTAPRQVVGPLVAGFTYLVINETTGGFDIVFGGSTGTTVSIAPGSSAWVSTDGTNWTQTGGGGGSPVAGSAGYVIFRPGVASSGQAVETEAELPAAIANGAVTIFVDSSVAPAVIGTITLNLGRTISLLSWQQSFSSAPVPPSNELTVNGGALVDLPYIGRGLHLVLAANSCSWTGADALFEVDGANVSLLAGSVAPAYSVPSGQLFEVKGINNSQFAGLAGVPLFTALAGGQLIVLATVFTEPNGNAFSASGGGTFIYAQDASSPPTSAFASITSTLYFDSDQQLVYGTGTAFPASPRVGQPFFRTDLNQEFNWNGTEWVGAGVTPLSRTIFVDGGSSATVHDGSISAPYTTIAAALASIPAIASASDAQSLITICVTPCLGGYASEPATLTVPANRNICLKGFGLAVGTFPGSGLNVQANISMANTATAPLPAVGAVLAINDLDIHGNITISDAGVGSPLSFLLLQSTTQTATIEGTPLPRAVTGSIIVTATECLAVVIAGYLVEGAYTTPGGCELVITGGEISGACTCGALSAYTATFGSTFSSVATSSNLIATESTFIGAMTGTNTLAGLFTDCFFHSPTIDLPPTQTFLNCRWIGVDPVNPQTSVFSSNATFDESSYRSFLAGGGSTTGGAVITVFEQAGAAFPANPFTGMTFFRTDLEALYTWSGTAWVPTGIAVGSSGYIIYRPGGVASTTVATTWPEVVTAQANGAVTLYIDSSLGAATTPGTGFQVPFFSGGIIGYRYQPSGAVFSDLLTVADTDTLLTPRYMAGITVKCTCATAPAFVFGAEDAMRLETCDVSLATGATVPACTVTGVLEVFVSYTANVSGVAGVALFSAASGGVIGLFAFADAAVQSTAIGGAAGSTVLFEYDASSAPNAAFSLVLGTYEAVQLDSDQSLAYGSGGAFPTTRPGGQALGIGQPFFRTDLNQEFIWNGTTWIAPIATTPAGASGYVIFRPGTPSAGQAVATAAELTTAVANGAETLYVDSSLAAATLPAGFTLPYFAGGIIGLHGLSGGFTNADVLTVDDTAQMTSPSYFETIKIVMNCTTTPALTYPAGLHLLRVLGSEIVLGAGATVPAFTATSSGGLEVLTNFSIIEGVAGTPLFSVASGGTLIGVAFTDSTFLSTALGGAAGSTLIFEYDASSSPAGTGFTTAGTYIVFQTDSDQNLIYGEGTAFPATSPGGQVLRIGQPFFRTDTNTLFIWNGTTWVGPTAVLPAGGSGYVIFRPGVASAGQAVATAAELTTAIANGALTIYVDSSISAATLPAGFNLDCKKIVALSGFNNNFAGPGSDTLTIADTATITNPKSIEGMLTVTCDCTTSQAFVFATVAYVNIDQASIGLANGAGSPAYAVPSGSDLNITLTRETQLNAGTSGFALFTAASGGAYTVFAYESPFYATGAEFGAEVGGEFVYDYDSSAGPPAWTTISGTYVPRPQDSDQAQAYGVGTANPTTPAPRIGQPFYRTDLTMPVWFDGTQWRNAAGVIVP